MIVSLLHIGEDDLNDICEALESVATEWMPIGGGLGVKHSKMKSIKEDHHAQTKSCLRETIATWLVKAYNVERFGEPTWKKLVSVVATAGSNPALAKRIASEHRKFHFV